MNWGKIFGLLKELLQLFGLDPTKAANWKVSVDTKKSGPVTKVTIGLSGLSFEFTHNGKTHTLTGKPTASNHAEVDFDGKQDSGAHMTFTTKHQPLKPLIVVFEFVDVTMDGAKHRFRFDCPK